MKLTTKLLKKLIKEEISRMNESFEGKGGYFGKTLTPSPNVDTSQFSKEDDLEIIKGLKLHFDDLGEAVGWDKINEKPDRQDLNNIPKWMHTKSEEELEALWIAAYDEW